MKTPLDFLGHEIYDKEYEIAVVIPKALSSYLFGVDTPEGLRATLAEIIEPEIVEYAKFKTEYEKRK